MNNECQYVYKNGTKCALSPKALQHKSNSFWFNHIFVPYSEKKEVTDMFKDNQIQLSNGTYICFHPSYGHDDKVEFNIDSQSGHGPNNLNIAFMMEASDLRELKELIERVLED